MLQTFERRSNRDLVSFCQVNTLLYARQVFAGNTAVYYILKYFMVVRLHFCQTFCCVLYFGILSARQLPSSTLEHVQPATLLKVKLFRGCFSRF